MTGTQHPGRGYRVPARHRAAGRSSGERLPSLREAERAHIVRILDACNWNKKEAARILEISRGTLYRKILEFGLEPQGQDPDPEIERVESRPAEENARSFSGFRRQSAFVPKRQTFAQRLSALYAARYSHF